MTGPILIFRIGYMKSYSGPDVITGGGEHIAKFKSGGEMWNFAPDAGKCYGYVMTGKFSGLDLRKVKSSGRPWLSNGELAGVDIVFIARRPDHGQVVVGWYRNATVFHKSYRKRPNPKPKPHWDKLDYLCEVDCENAVLLPESERTENVPYAPVHGRGLPGHSHVWYGGSAEGKKLTDRLRRYMNRKQPGTILRSANPPQLNGEKHLNKKLILAVENASMLATTKHFEQAGYSVREVHRDCCGWDLTAERSGNILRLEVKGHIGDVVRFELTPNEYAKMALLNKDYRVCVVRKALVSDTVEVFAPRRTPDGLWELWDKSNGTVLKLGEFIAARASEIA